MAGGGYGRLAAQMRQPTNDELVAIARLRRLPMEQRVLSQFKRRRCPSLGYSLPPMHAVLFTEGG